MAATTRAPITPAVFRWARELAGYEMEDVAHALNTKTERVASWESGEGRPTLNQLRRFAALVQRPPAFFFRKDPPQADLPQPPDFRSATDPRAPSVSLRRELRAVTQRREKFLHLHGSVERFAPVWDMEAEPEAAAAQAREALAVPISAQLRARDEYAALRLWINAIEVRGPIVFQTTAVALSEMRGASIYFDSVPIILLNAKDAVVGRIFTLIHELGHLSMGSGALCEVVGPSLRAIETQCNRFAAALLMPAPDFVRMWETGAGADIERLSRSFKVSQEAAAIRLFELGKLSRPELERIRAETRKRVEAREDEDAGSIIVPYHTRKLRDLGQTYVSAVLDAYYQERLTLTDVGQFLGVKVQHVPKMEDAISRRAGA